MMDERATWELVLEAASRFTAQGHDVFRLRDLVAAVQRLDPQRGRETIQPTVQGMTANAGKGPVPACGKRLLRIDHGLYRLLGQDEIGDVSGKPRPERRSVHRKSRGGVDLPERVAHVIEDFDSLVDEYDRRVPFQRSGQYESHRLTIDRRCQLGSVVAAIEDDRFLELLYSTLQHWGIGRRGSRLVPLDRFRSGIRQWTTPVAELDGLSIEASDLQVDSVIASLQRLVRELPVVENRSRIVAGTKTLHHLLPDLVPPMDRRWTGEFFGWSPADPQYHGDAILATAYHAFHTIAAAARPSRLVGPGWRTSSTKLLDNAVIAYCRLNR